MEILYITGAGVSAESGIPTFRGKDGFLTVGSKNYTPQEMATRAMYKNEPAQFLLWYFNKKSRKYIHIELLVNVIFYGFLVYRHKKV